MKIRKRCLKDLEDARGENGMNNPLDVALIATVTENLYGEIKKFEPELEDLCGVSRFDVLKEKEPRGVEFEAEDILDIKLVDLSEEPRCERSWKRGKTVEKRSNGRFLSERDALALGL